MKKLLYYRNNNADDHEFYFGIELKDGKKIGGEVEFSIYNFYNHGLNIPVCIKCLYASLYFITIINLYNDVILKSKINKFFPSFRSIHYMAFSPFSV